MTLKAQDFNKIFDAVIAKYLVVDDVDQPCVNIYQASTLEHLLYRE
ncbi:hypothetical protein Q4595_30840 [Wenyingzhuangia sp. 1_MG-2023]|nr:hypothetical protein [Wenyingzhuangia sp. 1_MG-2023]